MIGVKRIILSKKLFSELVVHAKKTFPYESISIISGHIKGDSAIAEQVYMPENIDKSTTTFTVEPIALLKIYNDIDANKRTLIGIYHTHPAAPYPSKTDIIYMEVNPYIWLISSTINPEKPRGYILRKDNQLEEVEVVIKKENN